jgi:hypothetical protein
MRKAGAILLAANLIFLSGLSLLSNSTSAGAFTTVTLGPEYQDIEIDVSPGSEGVGTAQINVTATTGSPAPLSVQLSASCPGAAVSIDPAGLLFQTVGTETKTVQVKLTFPILTSASEEIICRITGSWSQGATSGTVTPADISVQILPCCRMTIFSEAPAKEIHQGESTLYQMHLENTGNIDDAFSIKVVNQEELDDKGITVSLINQIHLDEGGFQNFEIEVNTKSDTDTRTYNINVRVESMTSEDESGPNVFEDYPLILKVKGNMDLKPSNILMIIGIVAVVSIVIIAIYKKRRS